MKKLAALSLLILASHLPSHATAAPVTRFTAKIYEPGGGKKVMYVYKSEMDTQADGTHVDTNTYLTPEGEVVGTDTATFNKDGALTSYSLHQNQLKTEGSVQLKDGQAEFSFTKDGKTKTDKEKVNGPFLVGPSVIPFLQAHWDEIMKGGTVKARFGVIDRLESVGFEFFKEKDDTIESKKVVVIKMKASSFLIAALVEPLHFYMLPDGSQLVQLRGRVFPKIKKDGAYKDLDTTTDYDYVSAGNSK